MYQAKDLWGAKAPGHSESGCPPSSWGDIRAGWLHFQEQQAVVDRKKNEPIWHQGPPFPGLCPSLACSSLTAKLDHSEALASPSAALASAHTPHHPTAATGLSPCLETSKGPTRHAQSFQYFPPATWQLDSSPNIAPLHKTQL